MEYRQPGDDDQALRSVLGRLLFSNDDIKKQVSVLSGGEKNRLSFGRLMLSRNNVLMLDEPTNHLDMESIESLQIALENTKARWFLCHMTVNLFRAWPLALSKFSLMVNWSIMLGLMMIIWPTATVNNPRYYALSIRRVFPIRRGY